MTIQTKFNIGDYVWFLHDNEVKACFIHALHKNQISLDDINWDLQIQTSEWIMGIEVKTHINKPESKLFKSKEELLKSL